MSVFQRASLKALRTRSRTLFASALLVAFCAPAMAADLKHPPTAQYVTLTPLAKKTSDGSTAELEITYKAGQAIPPNFSFYVDGKPFTAKQTSKNTYSVNIPFDFDGFVAEQELRKATAAKVRSVPVFENRHLVGQKPIQFLDPATLKRNIVERKPIRVLPDVARPFLRSFDYGEPSLVITDPAVVDDPTRTYDACTGQGNPNGVWTFKRLMENIANEPLTGINAADLVEDWVLSFGVDHTINSFPVHATTRANKLLTEWPRDQHNRLDLDHAPFRLLAIVNRVDLRDNSAYGSGGGGEGRFVFGIMDRGVNGQPGVCEPSRGTIILEYGVPTQTCSATKAYASQWHQLLSFNGPQTAYNQALQAITDQFTSANAAPTKPNGSALNQFRVNDFTFNSPWELREFHVNPETHRFDMVSTELTPHWDTFNDSPRLKDFVDQNATQILLEQHSVPTHFQGVPFLTGSAINHHTGILEIGRPWSIPGTASAMVKHKFALNTCNGCHGDATKVHDFTHIKNRGMGQAAALSNFMTGTPSINIGQGQLVSFNEIGRRQYDLDTFVFSNCSSGSVLTDVLVPVSLQTH
jgi:hypothetical protein